jgi:L-ascorbate metabolism protein UlaG (beta-lactamase superfamily)
VDAYDGDAVARIAYVGHATVLVELDGVRLLTDPLLRPRLLHLRRVGKVAAHVSDGLDAVLISHLHFDHLDFPSLEQIGRDVRVVVPRGAGRLVEGKGFGSVTELAVGEELRLGTLAVRATPARHDAARMPFGRRAEPMGYVIDGSCSVYFAGDTELFDGMASLGPIDIALVPISGWGPHLGPGHLDARDAAEAVRRTGASAAIPIHWGTYFPLHTALRGRPAFLAKPAEEFEARMREIAPDVDVRILRPGEETVVEKPRAGARSTAENISADDIRH